MQKCLGVSVLLFVLFHFHKLNDHEGLWYLDWNLSNSNNLG